MHDIAKVGLYNRRTTATTVSTSQHPAQSWLALWAACIAQTLREALLLLVAGWPWMTPWPSPDWPGPHSPSVRPSVRPSACVFAWLFDCLAAGLYARLLSSGGFKASESKSSNKTANPPKRGSRETQYNIGMRATRTYRTTIPKKTHTCTVYRKLANLNGKFENVETHAESKDLVIVSFLTRGRPQTFQQKQLHGHETVYCFWFWGAQKAHNRNIVL